MLLTGGREWEREKEEGRKEGREGGEEEKEGKERRKYAINMNMYDIIRIEQVGRSKHIYEKPILMKLFVRPAPFTCFTINYSTKTTSEMK